MGIKFLNRFLREECNKTAIKMIPLLQLSGKKIAVDISIYLYKYTAENSLIENMYLMLSIFRYYQIIPVFIFDGKPPIEKKDLLQKRREDKKSAEQEYYRLKTQLVSEDDVVEEEEKQDIQNQMDLLKKQFVTLKKEMVEEVKQLMRAFGATYYDAPGEADELCAALVIKNKVWACLSEDMDLFVYGCPRVLRYFSLLNHTAVLYDLVKIRPLNKYTKKYFLIFSKVFINYFCISIYKMCAIVFWSEKTVILNQPCSRFTRYKVTATIGAKRETYCTFTF
jgi:5'-3' exonuclease